MDQFHERENEEREIVAQSLEQPEQAHDNQPEEMVLDNMLVEFRMKRETAYRLLGLNTQMIDYGHYEALVCWFLRVCYFHATGKRLLNMQHVDECYGLFGPISWYSRLFRSAFETGVIDAEWISDEPMISLETYEKFLTAVPEGRVSVTTLTDDLGAYAFEVYIGHEGNGEKISTISLDISMALQMAE
jgi:hypothetical protein